MFSYFLLKLRIATKKILTVIKTILKARDPGDEIASEVNS